MFGLELFFWELNMVRLQVSLRKEEADVLMKWSASELRDWRDQIHFIIRQEMERRGLLPANSHDPQVEEQADEQAMDENVS